MAKIERERAEKFEKFAAFRGKLMAERFAAARRCEDMQFRDPMMMPCPKEKADFCRKDFMKHNNPRPSFQQREDARATEVTELYNKAVKAKKK